MAYFVGDKHTMVVVFVKDADEQFDEWDRHCRLLPVGFDLNGIDEFVRCFIADVLLWNVDVEAFYYILNCPLPRA